jgi:hypothetical protein
MNWFFLTSRKRTLVGPQRLGRHGSRARRLFVEPIEDRLMLSVSPLGAADDSDVPVIEAPLADIVASAIDAQLFDEALADNREIAMLSGPNGNMWQWLVAVELVNLNVQDTLQVSQVGHDNQVTVHVLTSVFPYQLKSGAESTFIATIEQELATPDPLPPPLETPVETPVASDPPPVTPSPATPTVADPVDTPVEDPPPTTTTEIDPPVESVAEPDWPEVPSGPIDFEPWFGAKTVPNAPVDGSELPEIRYPNRPIIIDPSIPISKPSSGDQPTKPVTPNPDAQPTKDPETSVPAPFVEPVPAVSFSSTHDAGEVVVSSHAGSRLWLQVADTDPFESHANFNSEPNHVSEQLSNTGDAFQFDNTKVDVLADRDAVSFSIDRTSADRTSEASRVLLDTVIPVPAVPVARHEGPAKPRQPLTVHIVRQPDASPLGSDRFDESRDATNQFWSNPPDVTQYDTPITNVISDAADRFLSEFTSDDNRDESSHAQSSDHEFVLNSHIVSSRGAVDELPVESLKLARNAEGSDLAVDRAEGGEISIAAVLDPEWLETGTGRGPNVDELAASEDPDDRANDESPQAITGELARAVAFASVEHDDQFDHVFDKQHDALADIAGEQSTDNAATERSSAAHSAPNPHRGLHDRAGDFILGLTLPALRAGAEPQPVEGVHDRWSQDASAEDVPLSAAFAEFDDADSPKWLMTTLNERRSVLGALPLLTVLALERFVIPSRTAAHRPYGAAKRNQPDN